MTLVAVNTDFAPVQFDESNYDNDSELYMRLVRYAKRMLVNGSRVVKINDQDKFDDVVGQMPIDHVDNEFLQYVDEAIWGSYGEHFKHDYDFPVRGIYIAGIGIVSRVFTFTFEVIDVDTEYSYETVDQTNVQLVCAYVTANNLTPCIETELRVRGNFPNINFTLEFLQACDHILVGSAGDDLRCVYGYMLVGTLLLTGRYLGSNSFFTCTTWSAFQFANQPVVTPGPPSSCG
jgi:hypothetical protein